MKKISIFASGSGTNAQNIFEYFLNDNTVLIDSLFSNKKDAYVLKRAENYGVPAFFIDKDRFYNTDYFVEVLKKRGIDLIVLAGFLWLIPENFIKSFRIINIHPALLPQYGGKGMYGANVHSAVVRNRESESGISIHYVNEIYDAGKIIFQAKCPVFASDTPEDVAARVHELEYKYFPSIIKKVIEDELI